MLKFSPNLIKIVRNHSPWKTTVASQIVNVNGSSPLTLSTGSLARFADGSAEVKIGETSVLAVVVWKQNDANNSSFLPLTVSFKQQLASLGRIPLSFDRRDRFNSPTEILTGRLIDRCIRPVFKSPILPDVELTCSVLSDDFNHDPDVVAINAASTALGLSSLFGFGVVGAVRVGVKDETASGGFLINPTRQQRYESDLDLVVSADVRGNITAIQSGCNKVPKELFIEALKAGTASATELANAIQEFSLKHGKLKSEMTAGEHVESKVEQIYKVSHEKLFEIFREEKHDKSSRDEAIKLVREHAKNLLDGEDKQIDDHSKSDADQIDRKSFDSQFVEAVGRCLKALAFSEQKRCDGRNLYELRHIDCKTSVYPALHGSALFCRGQTQVLCRLSFDSLNASQRLDPISASIKGQMRKHFMLHYQFPQYSVNAFSGSRMGANRRELGHGNLAEMGIAPLVPKDYKFAIRLVAEVLESNGSSSMASVCAASMALMDAGVELEEHAAGVAIGLFTDRNSENETVIEKHALLTDILGFEDFYGEMDFKMAGTKQGAITALQCDVKKHGIPIEIAIEAVERGTVAISQIVSKMENAIALPRDVTLSPNLPHIREFSLPKYQMGVVFGPGRMNVKQFEERGCTLTTKDEETLTVFAPNRKLLNEISAAIESRLSVVKEPVLQFGQICNAKIEQIVDKGVYVSIFQGQNPVFIPNFQLDSKMIAHASALGFEEGKTIKVKFFGRDPANGKMRLSRRALLIPGSELPAADFVSNRD